MGTTSTAGLVGEEELCRLVDCSALALALSDCQSQQDILHGGVVASQPTHPS